MLGNGNILFASLFWSSIGLGFAIYGKRAGAWVPMAGGITLMVLSYFFSSALWLSVTGVALVAAMVWLIKNNY